MVLKVHTSKPVAKMLGKVKIVLCIFLGNQVKLSQKTLQMLHSLTSGVIVFRAVLCF